MSQLEASMQIEQADDVHIDALQSIVSKIRRRLYRGEAISAAAMVHDYQCSNGLVSITVRELRALGYNFTETKVTGPHGQDVTAYTMADPTYWPRPQDFVRVTTERTAKQRGQKKQTRERKRSLPPTLQEQEAETAAAVEASITGLPPQKLGRKRGKPPLPVLPQIGSELRVVMVRIDEDTGTARIGLKNGTVSWEVLVEAQS